MELKRLLDRANVLLLQGAYQGAESFIEQAMAEADKLKSELAELDTLRNRVLEMAAEIERLQSVIDEANAQEPLTTIQVLQGYPHVVSHSQCGVKDGIYKVYAERPIPAQQSTLEYSGGIPLVPWSKEKELFDSIQQSPAVAVPDSVRKLISETRNNNGFTEDELGNSMRDGFDKALDLLEAKLYYHPLVQSPRITEQDAEAIIESYVESPDCFNDWIASEGRALLNKLNGDHNGK